MHILYNQVSRDHSAAEEHGDHVKYGDRFLSGEIVTGKRISGGKGNCQVYTDTNEGDHDGVEEAPHDLTVFKYLCISLQGKTHGTEQNLTGRYSCRIAEGRNNNPVKRIGHNKQDQRQDDEDDRIEDHIFPASLYRFCFHIVIFFFHVQFPPTTDCFLTSCRMPYSQ